MTALRHQALRELLDTDNEWVVTSSEALRILLQQAEETLGSEGCLKIRKQRIIVSHPRIAEMARELHFTNVHLTASGDDALLNALRIRT
jgi:uroporphyrinogen-III synthase